jgi:hypothetical protein
MRRLIPAALAIATSLALAGCGSFGGPAPTQTAIVLIQGTSPLVNAATATPLATEPANAPAATSTAVPADTPLPATSAGPLSTAEAGLAGVTGDPLLRTYRSLVGIQLNAALVAEAVRQVDAGRVDQSELPVAALAVGALTQSVDETLPTTIPPPALASQWQAAVAQHEAVKDLGGQWLLGQMSLAEISAALSPIQADLQRLLAEADAVVAAEYGVEVLELTSHRERLVAAIGGVFQ